MKLSITLENPAEALHWNAWSALGACDPTRVSPEHEQSLVQDLGTQGARLVLVSSEDRPILRYLAHELQADEGQVSLGFFALASDVDERLMAEAFQASLARLGSTKKLIAPMNGNTWFAYRLRTDAHDLSFDWEPPRQPALLSMLMAAGFVPWAHYHSMATAGMRTMQESLYKDWKRVVESGFSLRPLSGSELQGAALLELHRLSQIAFADNPLFVPLGFDAFARSYLQAKSNRENFLFAAYEPLGRCVAYFLAFLETGMPKTLVLKTAATDPSYRRQGLSNALLYTLCQKLPESISDTYYSALVFKGWNSESYARHGHLLWEHDYVLLAKDS